MFLQKIREAAIRFAISFVPVKLPTTEERRVEIALYRAHPVPPPRKTCGPLIVAMLGIVGSGKSAVAQLLAQHIGGALVIEGDEIRTLLRTQGSPLEGTHKIELNVGLEMTRSKGVVILDSDYIDAPKRAMLLNYAKAEKVKVIFVRTVCDLDVMFGRIMSADAGEFFNRHALQ